MTYMDHLYFSRRPAPDGLFGQRRFRLPPEGSSHHGGPPLDPERPPPRPLSPWELLRVAAAWRRRTDDPSSNRVAQALESLAARRMPPPVEKAPAAAPPKSVARKISALMGL